MQRRGGDDMQGGRDSLEANVRGSDVEDLAPLTLANYASEI